MKALIEVVRHDLKELMEALDELMCAIGRQTNIIKEQSRSKAQVLRELLQYRNARAREKARDLREKGEHLVLSAAERLKERAYIARVKAKSLRDNLMTSDAWRAYSKAHGDWSGKLKERAKRRAKQFAHERRKGLLDKIKEKRERNRKRKASTATVG